MGDVLRILDANANRAREALRVMEDAARLALNDQRLTGDIKKLRHQVTEALGTIDDLNLHRDSLGDVGTGISEEAEGRRSSVRDIVVAAGKRLGEALRSLEEYSKLDRPDVAAVIKQLRYVGYDVEQRLLAQLPTRGRPQWSVCVLLSERLCLDGDWLGVAQAALDGGADCIQLREKELPDRDLLARARQLQTMTAGRAALIINDRVDIAMLSGADGVHLGQDDLSPTDVRKIAGSRLIVGVSTSRIEEAKQALEAGADYCGVGPMFHSTTKCKEFLAGPAYLQEYVEWGRLPHLAIGGIAPENVHELVDAGCKGVAVSAAICGAADPAAVVRTLRETFASLAIS